MHKLQLGVFGRIINQKGMRDRFRRLQTHHGSCHLPCPFSPMQLKPLGSHTSPLDLPYLAAIAVLCTALAGSKLAPCCYSLAQLDD